MADIHLIQFNRLMHRVPLEERRHLIKGLDWCQENDGEPVAYKRNKVGYAIYRAIKKIPYMMPKYVEFVSEEDVKNRRLFEQISQGIKAYVSAPIETQNKFAKRLLNPWSLRNIVARLKREIDFQI